jgi:hypothetical protein
MRNRTHPHAPAPAPLAPPVLRDTIGKCKTPSQRWRRPTPTCVRARKPLKQRPATTTTHPRRGRSRRRRTQGRVRRCEQQRVTSGHSMRCGISSCQQPPATTGFPNSELRRPARQLPSMAAWSMRFHYISHCMTTEDDPGGARSGCVEWRGPKPRVDFKRRTL